MVSKILFINLMLHRRAISVVLVALLHEKSSSNIWKSLIKITLFFVGEVVDMGSQVITLLGLGGEHSLY